MSGLRWSELKAAELRALQARDAIVLVPVASMEQHGPHLPVGVDSMLAEAVALRTARRIAPEDAVVVAPTVWLGLAEHHMSFGGTFTLDLPTYHALLRCICGSLGQSGFRRILLLNGHGGNIAALTVITDALTKELQLPLATATYWIVAAAPFGAILERQANVGHACEAETSMMLALHPALVDEAAMRAVAPTRGSFTDASGIHVWRPTRHFTESGVAGDPTAATAEKGERLLDAAADVLAKHLLSGAIWQRGEPAPD
jgi:creatinine amidohydrolase